MVNSKWRFLLVSVLANHLSLLLADGNGDENEHVVDTHCSPLLPLAHLFRIIVMASHLSMGDRWRIISLRFDQKANFKRIASVVKCSVSTAHNIIRLFRETNDVIEREGRGRTLLNIHDMHTLRQLFYKHPTETAAAINNRFFRLTNIRLSCRTIRNYRRRFGFRPVHARQQPMLNETHARDRLVFCQRYLQNYYQQIVFSDEKAFEIDVSGVVHWIPVNRTRPVSFRSQIKYRIAVFGAIWYNSRSNLVFIRARTNTSTFVQYLQEAFNTHYRSIRQYHFIHDHARWAHSVAAHTWLHRHSLVCVDDYPAASPDLNAIESVWSWMNRFIQRHHPASQQQLEQLVLDAWNQIPQSVLRAYIDHVQEICRQVIMNQGWESLG